MKTILLAGFLAFAIPAFSQTEPQPTEVESPTEGEYLDINEEVQVKPDYTVYRVVKVKVMRWWWTGGKTVWEGYGVDAEGNYWYLEKVGNVILGTKLT